MKKIQHLITFVILLNITCNSFGQVGIGTTTPLGALDITANNDGLVIPRVALTMTTSAAPLTAPTTSEIVYNTATIADVTPGYYFWNGTAWVRFSTGTITETDPQVSSATTNRVPRWNNFAGTLQDGLITDNGTRVGINVAAPAGALEIFTGAFPDGLVIPRVALTATNVQTLSIAPVESELVYNTATAGTAPNNVTPGFYYWFGGSWLRIATTNNNGWSLTGNAGLSAAANFLGTTDAIDVAFRRNNLAAGRIGQTSTSFGVGALSSGAATNSTAIGNNALSVSTGNNNVAIGQNALRDCAANADFNTAVGTNALQGLNNAASNRNTVVGFEAMGSTTGDIQNCTAVGFQALYSINGAGAARGLHNTGIGYQAGNNITTGENNIAIGYLAQVPSATSNGQVRIGNAAIGYAGIQVGWTITSDKRWKDNIKDSPLGLNFLKTLRPVSYTRNNEKKQKTEYGFIAQEIETALQKAGDPNNGIITKDDQGMLGVRYNDFISISVKAIQEQQELIETLQKSNAELKKTNEAILERLERLEKK
jgi:hypothetical protein